MCCFARVVEKDMRRAAPIEANILLTEDVPGGMYDATLRRVPTIQISWPVPTGVVPIEVNDRTARCALVRPPDALTMRGKKGSVSHVVGRQGITHEDDVVGLHCRRAQVPLNFVDKRRGERI